MTTNESSKLNQQTVDKLFTEAVSAYQKRDYFQARELLKIVVTEDPLYSSNDRRASDLLADVEFQLAEKASAHRRNRILGALTILLGICVLALAIFLIVSTTKVNRFLSTSAASNATLAAQTGLLHSAYTTVTAASIRAESAQATMTTMRQNPGSAQSTIQAYENLVAAGSLSNEPILGPISGQLYHDDSSFVISEGAGINLKNMIIQARFINPYGSEENAFDYGFFFRDTGGDHQFRLVIDSDSTWIFDFVEDPTWDQIDSGTLYNFDSSAGGSNTIRLVILDDRALFYVNNEFITALSTQGKLVSGDVFIVTASYEDHEMIGRSTGYEDFTIWPLP